MEENEVYLLMVMKSKVRILVMIVIFLMYVVNL